MSSLLSPRTMPCRDSGLAHDTRNNTGTSGNFFERPLAQEGLSLSLSAIFNNSENLASSSQGLRPDTTETAGKRDGEMKRESLNTSVVSPHFQSRSGMLNHIGGIYSHHGMMDYPRIPVMEWNLGKFPDPVEFQSWKVISKLKYVRKQPILRSLCSGSKKLRLQNHLSDIAVDYRAKRLRRPRYAWCDDRVCIEKASQHADPFPKESKCRRAACSKTRPILTRKTNCVHDLRVFPCHWSLQSRTRTLRFVQYTFAEWRRPRFRRSMGSSSIVSKRHAFRCGPGRIVQVKWLQTVLALYDLVTFRNSGQTSYLRHEDVCKISYWSDDENSKLQGPERSCGKWSSP